MKNYLLIIALLLGGKAMAQSENPYWSNQTFRGGPILGMNFSQVDGDTDGGVHKVGIHAGVGSYVSLSQRAGMQLDILFSQKGSRFARETSSPSAGAYFVQYKMKLNYIEIPLSFQYYYNPDIHFGLGASFNRLLSSDESWLSLLGWRTFDSEVFPFEKNSWDGFLSASYRLTDAIRVEVRYQRSLTPIRTIVNTPPDFSNGPSQRNNLFVLRLGYYL